MRKNGRAWTEGFIVTVEKEGESIDVTFDVVTNEGGGLYGYVLSGFDYKVINLKTFKENFEKLIANKR